MPVLINNKVIDDIRVKGEFTSRFGFLTELCKHCKKQGTCGKCGDKNKKGQMVVDYDKIRKSIALMPVEQKAIFKALLATDRVVVDYYSGNSKSKTIRVRF
jgi:hypothetical protein